MDRDLKTGRFLPGNKAAVGNRGNTKPKWGNKNAVKHGLFSTVIVPKVMNDGRLRLYKKGAGTVLIKPEGYFIADEWIWIRDDVAEKLSELGYW